MMLPDTLQVLSVLLLLAWPAATTRDLRDAGPAAECPEFEGFELHPGTTQFGQDIQPRRRDDDLETISEECRQRRDCKGFTWNGWMKHTILPESDFRVLWPQKPCKGFYVRVDFPPFPEVAPYGLNIDCHGGLDHEPTDAFLRINCFYGSTVKQSDAFWGSSCTSTQKMLINCPVRLGNDGNITQPTSIGLSSFGIDEMFVDYVQLGRGCPGGDGCFDEVAAWGSDGGQGWCLSTDPNSNPASWDGFIAGAPGDEEPTCYKTLHFDVSSGSVNGTSN